MDKFDEVVRGLSVKMARTTTRRGFITRSIQASVGIGLIAGTLFGSGRRAFASSCLSFPGNDNVQWCADPAQHPGECNYAGDGDVQYESCLCGRSLDCQNCPTGYTVKYTYKCCCDHQSKRCTVCQHGEEPNATFCAMTQYGAAC